MDRSEIVAPDPNSRGTFQGQAHECTAGGFQGAGLENKHPHVPWTSFRGVGQSCSFAGAFGNPRGH